MNEIQAPKFHEPKPQVALNGELGLTSREIAESLGVDHDKVTRSIRAYIALDPQFPHSGGKEAARGGKQGRHSTVYTLPLVEARIVVAQYRSKVGLGFVRYLVEFEKTAREREPELRAAFAALEGEVASLRARLEATQRPRALPSPPSLPVVTHVARYESLHGEGEVFVRTRERLPVASLLPLEAMKAKRAHMISTAQGLISKADRLEAEIAFHEQPPAARLRAVETKEPKAQ